MPSTSRLWVPPGISWDAQIDRAIYLYNQGNPVEIHGHRSAVPCNEETRCGMVDGSGKLHPLDTPKESI